MLQRRGLLKVVDASRDETNALLEALCDSVGNVELDVVLVSAWSHVNSWQLDAESVKHICDLFKKIQTVVHAAVNEMNSVAQALKDLKEELSSI